MKIQITAGGIYDGKGEEIPVGSTFDVEAEPTSWAGRYTVLSGDDGEKTAITNPADQGLDVSSEALEGKTVAELKALADEYGVDLKDATKKDDIIAAIQLAAEPKA